eukprot:Opistho-1_new@4150
MHLAVGIDHAGAFVKSHARGPDVVSPVGAKAHEVFFQRGPVVFKARGTASLEFLRENIEGSCDRFDIRLAVVPVHAQLRHAQGVHRVRQHDPASGLRCLLTVHLQAETVGPVAQDHRRKLAAGEGAASQPVRQKGGGVDRIPHHIERVARVGACRGRGTVVQALAVFVADEPARQKQPRQHAAAVRWVGDAREVQAAHRIGQAETALFAGSDGQPAPAIHPFGRQFIAVPHTTGRTTYREGAHIAGDMAHVVAANHIMVVTDAGRCHLTRSQQQARGFQSTRSQHRRAWHHGKTVSLQCAYFDGLDSLAIGLQVNTGAVCAQQDLDACCQFQPFGITGSEMGGARKPLEAAGVHPAGVEAAN